MSSPSRSIQRRGPDPWAEASPHQVSGRGVSDRETLTHSAPVPCTPGRRGVHGTGASRRQPRRRYAGIGEYAHVDGDGANPDSPRAPTAPRAPSPRPPPPSPPPPPPRRRARAGGGAPP